MRGREGELEHAAFDGVAEVLGVEVDQQADALPGELEIRVELRLVDAKESIDRLEFDDYLVGDEEIDSEPHVDGLILVLEGETELAGEWDFADGEFVREARFIRGFEQPGSERRVHFERGGKDPLGEVRVQMLLSMAI
jgi:hypothetical protein